MTKKELKKIAKVLATADGGCSHCVKNIVEKFNKEFPDLLRYDEENEEIEIMGEIDDAM